MLFVLREQEPVFLNMQEWKKKKKQKTKSVSLLVASSHFYPACGLKRDFYKAMVPVLFQSACHFSLLISQASHLQWKKLMLFSPSLFFFLLNVLVVSIWRGWYFFSHSCPNLASYGCVVWFNLHLCAQISLQEESGDMEGGIDLGFLLTCRHARRGGKTEA